MENVKNDVKFVVSPSKLAEAGRTACSIAHAVREGDISTAAKESVKSGARSCIAASAMPAAVKTAGALGMTAKTGTAISALSGAAAVNATCCAVGMKAAALTGMAVASPAIVGGAIIAGGAAAVGYGVSRLIDRIWG